ncbi:hypothetical protein [Rhizobium sp. C4]|uniref:hypothetical protein n=1 Tax=Rhizobium sp. C4 TaxID=1349800 RepID=UPI001E65B5BB|nr:hypothetical protein [Rhizobium sp. C4]MCD2172505.1 hypothetical protein [Rhizobium sp. C4]
MTSIQDIDKLRPELMSKSDAELERQITELQLALEKKKALEEEKERAMVLAEARERIDRLVSDIMWLHEKNLLIDVAAELFSFPPVQNRDPAAVKSAFAATRFKKSGT